MCCFLVDLVYENTNDCLVPRRPSVCIGLQSYGRAGRWARVLSSSVLINRTLAGEPLLHDIGVPLDAKFPVRNTGDHHLHVA